MGNTSNCCGPREDHVSVHLLGQTAHQRESALVLDNPGKIDEFYEIKRNQLLGEGGFGNVVKGKSRKTGEVYAVKIQPKKGVEDFDAFVAEISLLKSLDHANILHLYEVFEDRERFYLITEICEGGELFDRIVEVSGQEDWHAEKQTAIIVQQVLRAVAYMHHVHIVHRDLKPENCLFVENLKTKPIEESTIKVIDLGIAYAFKPGELIQHKVGTVHYMAPEIESGKGYTEVCDLWSIGVIMYMLLVGQWPFGDAYDRDKAVLKRAAQGLKKHQLESHDWKYVTEEGKIFLRNLLEVDTNKRYTAEGALQDPWIKHQAPTATAKAPASLVSRLKEFQAMNKFMKTTLRMIAWRMDEGKIHSLHTIFTSLDTNGDGILSASEIREGILKAHTGEVPPDLEAILDDIHADGHNGEIDYSEFLAAMMDHKSVYQRDICWQAFRIYDKNGDGKIQRSELEEVFSCGTVENAMGPEAVTKFMSEIGKDPDAELDFEEFMAIITGSITSPR
jgi:calcium-dependent protein kinase